MPYIGKSPVTGNYNSLDDISGSFNSSTTTFNLLVNSGTALTPVRAEALIISINGVIQEPTTDFTVSAATIIFTTAPASSDSFFGVVLGQQLDIAVPGDGSVSTAKIADGAVTVVKLGATVTVAKGGTGAATHTANNVLVGAGTSAITSVAPSTSGNVLTSNGTVWASAAGTDLTAIADGSVGSPSLANSGDTNTGIYWPGADQLGLTTAGAAAMLIDATGAITKPLQPCFLARTSSVQSNLAVGSFVDIAFATERFDLGGDYSTPSFTAPITGKYLAEINLRLDNLDIDANYFHMHLTTSNYQYATPIMDFGGMSADPVYWSLTFSAIVDMDASDTAKVQIYQNGGAAQTDVAADSYFSMGLFA